MKGIIMSGNHPKLILDLIKTMTRRTYGLEKINDNPDEWVQPYQLEVDPTLWTWRNTKTGNVITLKCPYGQVGDRLWVRETWRILDNTMTLDDMVRVEYKSDGHIIKRRYGDIAWNEAGIDLPVIDSAMKDGEWKPAHHLPHILSRITLEITEEWAERLRSISPADAIAEGGYTVDEFIAMYLRLNRLPEDADPWNWAISFKVVK